MSLIPKKVCKTKQFVFLRLRVLKVRQKQTLCKRFNYSERMPHAAGRDGSSHAPLIGNIINITIIILLILPIIIYSFNHNNNTNEVTFSRRLPHCYAPGTVSGAVNQNNFD